mmetsp:Transcript_9572/g.14235  ORF Transcript_9572/g.14235 Transcript_9572/m.14235 type:complete len:129 (+) Transcript_9572:1569-1955(+)
MNQSKYHVEATHFSIKLLKATPLSRLHLCNGIFICFNYYNIDLQYCDRDYRFEDLTPHRVDHWWPHEIYVPNNAIILQLKRLTFDATNNIADEHHLRLIVLVPVVARRNKIKIRRAGPLIYFLIAKIF